MGRSGYTDDYDESETPLALYRQAVRRAITGQRGQDLLRKLLDALDAMSVKRLIRGAIKDDAGEVCAFGALDPSAPSPPVDDWYDEGQADELAKHFGIARALAAEIAYMNDEFCEWQLRDETPEQRWIRMRAWVAEQIAKPQSADAVARGSEASTD